MTTLENLALGVGKGRNNTVTFLPEPEPRATKYVVVSVDDHIVEPRDAFEGRFPAHLADRAPRIIETETGAESWLFEDRIIPNVGTNAVIGRPPSEYSMEPARFDFMRPGCYDVDQRVKDMDTCGVWASLCFPSMVAGFAGTRFAEAKDPELGLAAVRAWNDWHLEGWCGKHPERFIPQQVTWLKDPLIAADEIRKNASRGFRSLSFPEIPERLGLPSIHSGHWDPILQACEDTDTVISLHVGSASHLVTGSKDAPADVIATLFWVGSTIAVVDWLFSKVALRYPRLKIAISEGGVGWVPALMDRIDHCFRYKDFTGGWINEDLHPNEVLQRNFFFCALDDTAGFEMLQRIGENNVMVECDYPHADSTWPDTQTYLEKQLGWLPEKTIEKLTWGNASRVYGFDIAPEAFRRQAAALKQNS